MKAVIWSGVAIAFVFLLARLFGRWKGFRKLFFDDAFVVFAWLLALVGAVECHILAKLMFQTLAITSGQLWPLPATFVEDTERILEGSVIVLIFFDTSLWAVKLSFLLFFKRLGRHVRKQKVLWWCVFAFTVATYLVCVGNKPYYCMIAPLEETQMKCTTESAERYRQLTLKLNCALDVLTDFASM